MTVSLPGVKPGSGCVIMSLTPPIIRNAIVGGAGIGSCGSPTASRKTFPARGTSLTVMATWVMPSTYDASAICSPPIEFRSTRQREPAGYGRTYTTI